MTPRTVLCILAVLIAWALPAARADLVGSWPFDTKTGKKSPDVSGNRHHAELLGKATIVRDEQRGTVLELQGKGSVDTVSIPTLARKFTIPEKGGATISAWVKRLGDANGGDAYDYIFHLIGKEGEQISMSLNARNDTGLGPSKLHVFIEGDKPGNNTDGDQVSYSAPPSLPDGEWVHVALTVDRDMDKAVVYINTVPLRSIDLSKVGDGKLTWAKAGIGEFGGHIDDLRLFDEPLAPQQVAELTGFAKPEPRK